MTSRRTLLTAGAGAAIGLADGTNAAESPVRRIALVAGKPSHPTLMHEYRAGFEVLKKGLDRVPGIQATVYTGGWPDDPKALETADSIILYMDGGDKHGALEGEHLLRLAGAMKRGAGLGCLHYAVEMPKGPGGERWQEWIGGYYETYFSVNPMWEPDFREFPKHPITRGVKPFKIKDEWYFNMRFRPGTKGVRPILTATPSDAVRKGPYVYPQGPYEHIVAESGREEHMMWCVERPDGGRGFGFTGGHFHLNWGTDEYRKIALNAIVWSAKGKVPSDGVPSTVTPQDLYQNLDDKPGRPDGPPKE
jgi:type 1 glutamine amidotransferase